MTTSHSKEAEMTHDMLIDILVAITVWVSIISIAAINTAKYKCKQPRELTINAEQCNVDNKKGD